jgi:hypothetical protein
MSATRISASERPVGDIFSDGYRFEIPRYQRPFAWTTEQGGEMFDDLLGAAGAQSLSGGDDVDPYFLGSLVLVKREDTPDAEVVDGQQRLTTLTILLATLRHYVSLEFAEALEKLIYQKGDPIRRRSDQPRLLPRERDRSFFESYVQSPEGLQQVRLIAVDTLPDSRRNVVENVLLFDTRLATLSTEECERLASFVVVHTYLVVVATQDFDSAYRIFAVLNERGLDLTHTDILKSEVIGGIQETDQDLYTKKWETEEEDLGRDGFADLFAHIRMVYAKTKARESILKEFRTHVLSGVRDNRVFIDDILVPLSDAFEVVTRSDYRSAGGADAVNDLLRWLNRLDNVDWIPPAIRFMREPTVTAEDARRFLVDLERLAASLLLRRIDITRRIERYGSLLTAMEAGADLYADESPLQLDAEEREETRSKLAAQVYTVRRVRQYLLLRLDSVLSGGGASYDYPVISVEHVLPQSPKPDSQWREWFTDDEREYWTHRLANLLLLTQRKNSQASNYEFEEKKTKYFTSSAGGVSPFVLTTQVIRASDWTPERLEARQAELIEALSGLWRL